MATARQLAAQSGFDQAREETIQYALPLLSGGITQQPHVTRFLNQFEDAENCDFTVFDGLRKRAGTYYVSRIDNTSNTIAASADCQVHKINRSSDENYLVVLSRNSGAGVMRVRVFDQDGTEYAPTISAAAATYLYSSSAEGTDLRCLTIADGTFIANTKVSTALTANSTYALDRTYKNADVMMSNTPSANSYHRALRDGDLLDAGYWQYTPGSGTFPTYTCTPAAWSDWVLVNGVDWRGRTLSSPAAFRIAFQKNTLAVNNADIASVGGSTTRFTLTLAGAFSSYTFEAGDQMRLTAPSVGAATFPGSETVGWVTVVSKDSNDQITVDAAEATPTYAAGRSVRLIDLGGTDTIDIEMVGREYEISIDFETEFNAGNIADMDDIAARIQEEFRRLGEDGVTVAWVPTTGGAGKFRVGGPWYGTTTTICVPQPPLSGSGGAGDLTLTGRPFSATSTDYTIAAGTGTGPVRVSVEDRWTRVGVSGDTNFRPTNTTMPVLMTRSAGPTFAIDVVTWDSRVEGDNTTNPAPKLFTTGSKIQDMLFHQNRLWLFGGSYATSTEAGNLYNFYKTDDVNLVESDRIEVEMGGTEVPTVQRAIAIRNNIAVTTENGRVFELGADNGPWTPASVGITAGPAYKTVNAKPAVMDDRMYFLFRRLGKTGTDDVGGGLAEYAYDDVRAQNSAVDVSGHVPRLFEDTVRRVEAVPTEGAVFILSDVARSMYVWRTYFGPGNRREQSAWTEYTIEDGDRIVDVALMPNGLYLFIESGGQYWWERMVFDMDYTASFLSAAADYPYSLRMDRIHLFAAAAGVYDAGNNWTTWTLPYADSTIDTVVLDTGVQYTPTRPTTSTVRVAGGDYTTGIKAAIGRSFTMVATFSRQFIRTGGGGAMTRDKLNLKRATFHYRRVGDFYVRQQREFGGDINHTVTNTTVSGQGERQVFHLGWSDKLGLEIRSTDAKPCVIPQVEFEADAGQRPI